MIEDKQKYNFVQSRYLRLWVGVILNTFPISSSYPKKYNGVGYIVLVVKDRNGNVPRKRIIHKRNKDWFKPSKEFDISHINKDWFKL